MNSGSSGMTLSWPGAMQAKGIDGSHGCSQHGVEILPLALATLPGRAILTMDLLGGEIFSAVQGNQHMRSQPPELIQAAVHAFQDRDRFGKNRIKQIRRRWIEHVPDAVIRGDLGDIEQGLAIRTGMVVFKPPLKIEKRRALHEKRRERCHPEIGDPIARIRPATRVGQPFQASAQQTQEAPKYRHPLLESDSRRVANPLRAHRVKKSHATGPSLSHSPALLAPSINIDSS